MDNANTKIKDTGSWSPFYYWIVGAVSYTHLDVYKRQEHGAAHKKTAVTRVGGELAAGQSRKPESFLAANDTVLVEQESVWDGDNWLLLSSGAHEYLSLIHI